MNAQTFSFLLSEHCFDVLVTKRQFTGECVSLLISKLLGYLILAGSFMLKVPQILSILSARSAEGVSSSMYYLDSLVMIVCASYGLRTGMAFSTYGESYFLLLQNLVILGQIHFYSRRLPSFFAQLALFAAFALYFTGLLPLALPLPLLTTLQSVLPIPVGALSRIPQIIALYRSGSAGSASFVMFLMNTAGALARVFTTMTEVQDLAVLGGYISSSCLNGIITAQIFYYSFIRKTSEKPKKN